ncbi:MAG: hypothetical protein DMG76_32615 [Acidobacteria bacterium]|nr:MAG: hypothetical protein DMG76_32615 [Acidobacteriota bacterium]
MARKPSLTSPARPTQTSTPSPITPRLVTIKQAAAYCSCAVWAIRQAIWSKELRACMIGKRYLIDRGDFDRFITLDGVSGCRDLLASGLCFLGFFE